MKYLLDTNAITEPTRDRTHRGLLRRFELHFGQVAIAAPTWHEILFGIETMPEGRRKKFLREYYEQSVRSSIPVLEYDVAAAEWHARERARLGARGRVAPFADGQIAAVAAVRGLTLVTANVKDFAAFEGLDVTNWAR